MKRQVDLVYRVKVDRDSIKNHFHYYKWKYIIGILVTVFSWNLLTTITAPKTPADKKIDIFLVGGYMLQEQADEYAKAIKADFPELLEVNITNIEIEGDMGYAGWQKLMVMTGSQTGDIYSFPEETFKSMAELGNFMPLDDYKELLSHFSEEQLKNYTFTTEYIPEPKIYGVPISDVESIGKSFFITENAVMGVTSYSQNSEKAVEVLKWIIEHKALEQYQNSTDKQQN